MRALPTITATLLSATLLPAMAAAQESPSRGTITVEPADERPDQVRVDLSFADAVRKALLDANFLALPGSGHGRFIARISVVQRTRGLATTDPAEAPSHASAGDWAVRFHATLPSHKTDLDTLLVTQLTIRIVERDGMKTIWSGSALTAGAASIDVADKLAEAVIRRYPTPTPSPIPVP
jgi:hypothetical protein